MKRQNIYPGSVYLKLTYNQKDKSIIKRSVIVTTLCTLTTVTLYIIDKGIL